MNALDLISERSINAMNWRRLFSSEYSDSFSESRENWVLGEKQ